MSRHRRKNMQAEGNSFADKRNSDALYGRKSLRKTAMRAAIGLFLMPIAFLLIVGGIGLYLFQGQEFSHSTIDNQVHASLQAIIGDEYEISIGKTGLSLISTSILSLNGKKVQIFKSGGGRRVAVLDRVKIGIDPVSVFTGSPRFDQLVVEGGSIDLTHMSGGKNYVNPQQLLESMGKQLTAASQAFARDTIDQVRVSELEIKGLKYGQRDPDNATINVLQAHVMPDLADGFSISADVVTKYSSFSLGASWQKSDNGNGYSLSAGLGPLNSLEWFAPADPVAALDQPVHSGVGLATDLRADIRIAYDGDLHPGAPYIKLQAEGGLLRLGKEQTTPVKSAVANLRSDLSAGEITLERAELSLGDISFEMNGTASTAPNSESTDSKSWNFQATLDNFFGPTAQWKDNSGQEKVDVSGVYVTATRTIDFKSVKLLDGQNSALTAKAVVKLVRGTSAGISGNAASANLGVQTLQKFWPFYVAPKFRTWLHTRVKGGRVSNLNVEFSIAEGRLEETTRGIGFREDEFKLETDLADVAMETFGELPEMQRANGRLSINGSALKAFVDTARLDPPGKGVVMVDHADFAVADIFKPPVMASLKTRMGGDLASVASLSNAEPLKVVKRIGVQPSSLSGKATADIEVSFPLSARHPTNSAVWKADLALAKASSSAAFFGQTIKNGDVKISATPKLVKAKGKANINGFAANLDIAEPINDGPSSKRYRKISTVLDHKALAKEGIDISTVVMGEMAVTINTDSKNRDRYEIDLKDADVSLPWISWLKGRGIPANASFILSQKDGINTLSDFSFKGPTFKAAGRLSFDKSGLLAASLKNVVLVRGDAFDVTVSRKQHRFVIAANGRAFDGRAIINKVIHKDGISGSVSNSDVTLTANFGRLGGFNSQVMENALVRYQTDGGFLTKLEVRGALDGKLSKIDAFKRGKSTTFKFASDNAGAALSMVDLYRKMETGKLSAKLVRNGEGPFVGNVLIKDFIIAGEERLKSLVAAPASDKRLKKASGKLRELNIQRVRFDDMKAKIEKDTNLFAVQKGRLRNTQIGLTFDGTIYDPNNQMSVRGTFMPLFAISRLIGEIPIIGDIFSNGKNSGLIGITYRLKGAADNPTILVNPVSIIAPGVFKDIFQFQR